MDYARGNLLTGLPDARQAEVSEVLLESAGTRFERIVSHGQASPEGFWYEQTPAEWVCVLQGWGEVTFEGGATHRLQPGDWLNIPAGARHRVAATAPDQPTVWLAVFYNQRSSETARP